MTRFMIVAVVAVLFTNMPLPAADPSKISKPNIIFILADDFGVGNVGCYGADHYKTPNIDALASGGTRYTVNILDKVDDLVCGDAYLIDGQSNAEATDVGKYEPKSTNEWVRSFGSMAGDPINARLKMWGHAVSGWSFSSFL